MSIRSRIVLILLLAVGTGFYFLVGWVQDDLRPRYLESLEEPLVDMSHLLAEIIALDMRAGEVPAARLREAFDKTYARRFHAQIYALDKHRVDIRVYVTDPDGRLVFDSDGRGEEGRDYSRWNDVYRTLRGEYGARITHDDPLYPGRAVLYIAAPIQGHDGIAGVVSVGKPARNVDLFLVMAKSKIAIAGAIVAVLVVVLGLGLSLWVTRPLSRLVAYARDVEAGRRASLPRLGGDEIGALGSAMEGMRVALEGKAYVERYVQGLTHELKSPLAAIRGAAELLQEDPPRERRARFASNIQAQALRAQELVERLLELASLEKRQGLERREPVDLRALVDGAVEGLYSLAAERGVRFEVDLSSPPAVSGDRLLLQQALINLLRNALAFSAEHGTVSVDTRLDDDRLCLRVGDEGPGVPDYALARVFERFYSLPAPDQAKGTGLGLSFVREVAKLHGGEARIENSAGGGARAHLCLPLGA